ncbi:MAG: hypothetical protein XD36_3052 [Halomonas sp. 54_146]|nr:MAG: hypothetical protein XD36_3052 [Halomonas sp. 54_146]
MAHHDMIQDANIHQAQRFFEPLGNPPIGVAGLVVNAGTWRVSESCHAMHHVRRSHRLAATSHRTANHQHKKEKEADTQRAAPVGGCPFLYVKREGIGINESRSVPCLGTQFFDFLDGQFFNLCNQLIIHFSQGNQFSGRIALAF